MEGEVQRLRPSEAPPPKVVQAVHLEDYVPAPVTGVYEPLHEVGSFVESGQVVGRLHDFERPDAPALELRAPRSGYLLMQAFQAPTAKGTTILVVAGEVGGSS